MPNFCGSCGSPTAGMRYCENCGVPLTAGSQPEPVAAGAPGWPCAGGNPGHSNFSLSEQLIGPDTIAQLGVDWTFSLPGGFRSQPIVADGRVYIAAPRSIADPQGRQREGGLHCLDATSGLLIWRNAQTGIYNSNSGDLVGSPAYETPWLYCQFDYGPLWAIDASTGDPDTARYVASCGQRDSETPPTIASGMLFHAEYSDVFVEFLDEFLSRHTSTAPWTPRQSVLDARSDVLGALALDGGWACAGTAEGTWIGHAGKNFAQARFVAFPEQVKRHYLIPDPDLEEEEYWNWNNVTSTGCTAGLGYFTMRIRVSDPEFFDSPQRALLDSVIVCGRLDPPEILWMIGSEATELTDCAIAYDAAFFADAHGVVQAMDLASGIPKWTHRSPDSTAVLATPLVVNGLVLFGTEAGSIYGLDARTGDEVWRFELGAAVTGSPAIANGQLFVPTATGLSALSLMPASRRAQVLASSSRHMTSPPAHESDRVSPAPLPDSSTGSAAAPTDRMPPDRILVPDEGELIVGIDLPYGLYRAEACCQGLKDEELIHVVNGLDDGMYGLLLADERITVVRAQEGDGGWLIPIADVPEWDVLAADPPMGTCLIGPDLTPGKYRLSVYPGYESSGVSAVLLDKDLQEVTYLPCDESAEGPVISFELAPTDFALQFYGRLKAID